LQPGKPAEPHAVLINASSKAKGKILKDIDQNGIPRQCLRLAVAAAEQIVEIGQEIANHEPQIDAGVILAAGQIFAGRLPGSRHFVKELLPLGKAYGGLDLDQAKRMNDLERENVRLRHLAADLSHKKQVLKPQRSVLAGSQSTCGSTQYHAIA